MTDPSNRSNRFKFGHLMDYDMPDNVGASKRPAIPQPAAEEAAAVAMEVDGPDGESTGDVDADVATTRGAAAGHVSDDSDGDFFDQLSAKASKSPAFASVSTTSSKRKLSSLGPVEEDAPALKAMGMDWMCRRVALRLRVTG